MKGKFQCYVGRINKLLYFLHHSFRMQYYNWIVYEHFMPLFKNGKDELVECKKMATEIVSSLFDHWTRFVLECVRIWNLFKSARNSNWFIFYHVPSSLRPNVSTFQFSGFIRSDLKSQYSLYFVVHKRWEQTAKLAQQLKQI
jgi:hypothetical protein